MQVDRNVTEFHGNLPHSRDLDPDPQKFTQVTSSLGMANDPIIACPDKMNSLLEPATSFSDTYSGLPSVSSTGIHNGTPRDSFRVGTGLQKIVSLAVLAEDGLCNAIERRTSLIHTCVLSLYFHDLNLLDHFNTMGRFLLMRDPQFTESLSQALFEGDMGLVSRAVRASRTEVVGCRVGTALGGSSRHGLGYAISTAPGEMLFAEPLPWPPRSGELEMTLRAVLLDCIQYSHDGGDLFRSAVEVGNARSASSIEIEDGGAESLSASIRRARRRKRLSVSELERSLAFAVRDYDDDSKIPKDINGK